MQQQNDIEVSILITNQSLIRFLTTIFILMIQKKKSHRREQRVLNSRLTTRLQSIYS